MTEPRWERQSRTVTWGVVAFLVLTAAVLLYSAFNELCGLTEPWRIR